MDKKNAKNITVGEKLRQIRKKEGYNQKDFSSILGVKQSYYSELENDKRKITTKILSALSGKFGISTNWILGYDENEALQKRVEQIDEIDNFRNITKIDFFSGLDSEVEGVILLKKLIKANKDISEMESSYSDIEGNIMLIESYVTYYGITSKMNDALYRFEKKQINFSDLMEEFKKHIVAMEELYSILEPYKNIIEEIHKKVSDFNDEHDRLYCIDENDKE